MYLFWIRICSSCIVFCCFNYCFNYGNIVLHGDVADDVCTHLLGCSAVAKVGSGVDFGKLVCVKSMPTYDNTTNIIVRER